MTSEPRPRRRAASYLRESTEEQGKGYSPQAQREGIAAYAASNNMEVVEEYLDFHSGWRASEKRPEFQRMISDAAAGKFEVVLVFHSSRFARDTVTARSYKRMLREGGIDVISVMQPFLDDGSPATFIAEGINELFDEYYSVTQSFWTSSGLQAKKRQGGLIGPLPWGLVRDSEGNTQHDPERAPVVKEMFERYATGGYSDRDLATWLNTCGARTAKGNPFTKDTVREMLVNAAYAGYVTARREKAPNTRGNFEPIIDWTLFERVQQVREARTRTRNPGRPGIGYALSGLLRCDRCGSKMHGNQGGRRNVRRYQCSGRKQGIACDAPIVLADEVEEAVADYVRAFNPPQEVRLAVIRLLKRAAPRADDRERVQRRSQLLGQLERLKELFVLGDITKDAYLQKKMIIEAEVPPLEMQSVVDVHEAASALTSFGLFWERETDAKERNMLLRLIFEEVTQDAGRLISVTPRKPFLPYFQFGAEAGWEERERRDSNPRPPA